MSWSIPEGRVSERDLPHAWSVGLMKRIFSACHACSVEFCKILFANSSTWSTHVRIKNIKNGNLSAWRSSDWLDERNAFFEFRRITSRSEGPPTFHCSNLTVSEDIDFGVGRKTD